MTRVADENVRDAATIVRAALDAVAAGTWLAATVDRFPAGDCGHASELLGRHLRDTLGI
jgi:hypothetical protein